MKKTPPMSRFLLIYFVTTILILVQFPTVSLAFNFGNAKQSNNILSFPTIEQTMLSDSPTDSPNSVQTVFSNATSISVTDRGAGNPPNGISSPYPSNINVSGLVGTLNGITVTINGYTTSRPRDIDMVVVAPTGQAFLLMADCGDLTATSAINMTFSDAAATAVPTGAGSSIPAGTYRPTDAANQGGDGGDNFPAPGPGTTFSSPAPTGTATFASVFNGINPNGNWSLYIEDDSLGGGVSTISGGWSLDITTAGAAAPTTTTVASSLNPSLIANPVTFTSTVTSSGNPVTTGTVAFTQNGTTLPGCSAVALNGSGQAACTAAGNTLPEGTLLIRATYSGTASFATSNGTLNQVVNRPTVVSGTQFCNNGGITLPDQGSASVYPSNITVSGLPASIGRLIIVLNNVNAPRAQDIDLLLVGPGGQALKIVSDSGNATAITGVNLAIADSGATQLPSGSTITSGTFKPTDIDVPALPDSFPAPAPGAFSSPAPTGIATLASVFNTTNPNGNWSLYAVDDSLGGSTSTIGSWCLNVIVTTAANASLGGQVVSADGRGVSKAFVTITDERGNTWQTLTNPFGYYRFTNVQVGSGYIINVKAKNMQFASQFQIISGDTDNVNFTASE